MSTEQNQAAAAAAEDQNVNSLAEAWLNAFEEEEVEASKAANLENPEGRQEPEHPQFKKQAPEGAKKTDEEDGDENEFEDDFDKKEDWDEIKFKASDKPELNLEQLNEFMGTSFATLDEARAAFGKKPDPSEKKATDPEEIILEDNDKTLLSNLQGIQKLDNEELMRLKLTEDFIQAVKSGIIRENKGYTTKPDGTIVPDKEEIEFKLDSLKDDWAAYMREIESFKTRINGAINTLSDKNKRMLEVRNNERTTSQKKTRENLQVELKKLSTFMGINVDPKIRVETYKDVTSGKFFEEITKDDETVAEVALLHKLYKKYGLEKTLRTMGVSDGKAAMFNQVHEHQQRNSAGSQKQPQRPGAGDDEYAAWRNVDYKS